MSKLSSNCPYCSRQTRKGNSRTIMPDRNLNDRWWHNHCMTRFIAYNTSDERFNANEFVAHLKDNLTKLIKEVNVKEAQLCYQKVVIKQ
jgi:transcriptional regulator NrdR family protein